MHFQVVGGKVSTTSEPLEVDKSITIDPTPVPLNGAVDITIGESITGLSSASILDLILEKPSGATNTNTPVDITSGPATIPFPDPSSNDGIVAFNEAGLWRLSVLIYAYYEDYSSNLWVVRQDVLVLFNVLPEFPVMMLAVVTPLATLAMYMYRKRNSQSLN